MGKWIDADALKEYIGSVRAEFNFFDDDERARYEAHSKAIYLLDLYVSDAPSIDIEPKQGEWIVYEGGWKDLDYYPPKCKCNQCGYEEELYILNAKPTNFCPNCGADMRERKESE